MELWPDEYLPDDYKGTSAGTIANIAGQNLHADMLQNLPIICNLLQKLKQSVIGAFGEVIGFKP